MSHAAKLKNGLASGHSLPPLVQAWDKNKRAPTHDYKLNQEIMYFNTASKKRFTTTIVHLLDAK